MSMVSKTVDKVANSIMNADGKESIIKIHNYVYENPRLKNRKDLKYERVGVYMLDGLGSYQFDNVTRKEGYELDPKAVEPLPTRINEKVFVRALNLFYSVFNRNAGMNIIICKEVGKKNYRVAYLEVAASVDVWAF